MKNDQTVKLSEHAIDRARERFKWNRSALERMTAKALAEGVGSGDFSGSLKRYLDKLQIQHRHRDVILGDVIFVFGNETLITVLNLPKEFRNAVHSRHGNKK